MNDPKRALRQAYTNLLTAWGLDNLSLSENDVAEAAGSLWGVEWLAA